MSSDSDQASFPIKRKKIFSTDTESSNESFIIRPFRRKKTREVNNIMESSDDDSDVPKPRRIKSRVVSDEESSISSADSDVRSNNYEENSSSSALWQTDWSSSEEVEEETSKKKSKAKRKYKKSEKSKPKASTSEADSDSTDDQSEKCPICLLPFREQQVGTPATCEHCFCLDCLFEWSKNVNSCPIDRQLFTTIHMRNKLGGKIIKHIPVELKPPVEDLIQEDLTYCEVCHQSDREDRMLLCDGCDSGYHLECLSPPMQEVPWGTWYCPECAQNSQNDAESIEIDEDEVPDLMEEARRLGVSYGRIRGGQAPQDRVNSNRMVPRTRQMERVRANIRANNRARQLENAIPFDPNQPSTSLGLDSIGESSHNSPPTHRPTTSKRRTIRKCKVTRRKRRSLRKNKKSVKSASSELREVRITEINADGEEEEIITYVRVNPNTGRKYKKKSRKRRKARKLKRPGMARTVSSDLASTRTTKRRLAKVLGICPPIKNTPALVPSVKSRQTVSDSSRLIMDRHSAGIPRLSLFGSGLGLEYSPPGSDDEFNWSAGNGPLSSVRRRSAVASTRRHASLKSISTPIQSEDTSVADLLGSIISSQELWHSKKKVSMTLKADGSLLIEGNCENKHSVNNNESPKKEKEDRKEVVKETREEPVTSLNMETPLDLSNVNPSNITQAPMYNNSCGGNNRGNFRGGYRDGGRHSHGGQGYVGRESFSGSGRNNYGGSNIRDNFNSRDFGHPVSYNPNFEHCGPAMFGGNPPFRNRNPQQFRNDRFRFNAPERFPFNDNYGRPPFQPSERFHRPLLGPMHNPELSSNPINVPPIEPPPEIPIDLSEDTSDNFHQDPMETFNSFTVPDIPDSRQDNEDCDIYCDIETSKADCDAQDNANSSTTLLPPPEPPTGLLDFDENSKSDRDNDSDQELVIDDSQKEEPAKENTSADQYDPFAVESDSNDSMKEKKTEKERETEEPILPLDAEIFPEITMDKIKLTAYDEDDDDFSQEDCPNFSIYSSQTMDVARHTEQELSQQIGPLEPPPPVESSLMEPPDMELSPIEPIVSEPSPTEAGLMEPSPIEQVLMEPPSIGPVLEPPHTELAFMKEPPTEPVLMEPPPIESGLMVPPPIEPLLMESPPVEPLLMEPPSMEPVLEEPELMEPPPLEPPPMPPIIPDDDDIIVGDVQACDLTEIPEPSDSYVEALQKERRTLSKIPSHKISSDSRGKITFKIGNKLKLSRGFSNSLYDGVDETVQMTPLEKLKEDKSEERSLKSDSKSLKKKDQEPQEENLLKNKLQVPNEANKEEGLEKSNTDASKEDEKSEDKKIKIFDEKSNKDKKSKSSDEKSDKDKKSKSFDEKSDKDKKSKSSDVKSDKDKKSKWSDVKTDKGRRSRLSDQKSDKDRKSKSFNEKFDKDKKSKWSTVKSDKDRKFKSSDEKSDRDKKLKSSDEKSEKSKQSKLLNEKSDKSKQSKSLNEKSEKNKRLELLDEKSSDDQQTKMLNEKSDNDQKSIMLDEKSLNEQKSSILDEKSEKIKQDRLPNEHSVREKSNILLDENCEKDKPRILLDESSKKNKSTALLDEKLEKDDQSKLQGEVSDKNKQKELVDYHIFDIAEKSCDTIISVADTENSPKKVEGNELSIQLNFQGLSKLVKPKANSTKISDDAEKSKHNQTVVTLSELKREVKDAEKMEISLENINSDKYDLQLETFPIQKDVIPVSVSHQKDWDSDGAYTPCRDELPVKDLPSEIIDCSFEPVTPTKGKTDDFSGCKTPAGYAGLGTEAISETDEVTFEDEIINALRRDRDIEEGEIMEDARVFRDKTKEKKKKDKREKGRDMEKDKENISDDNLVSWKKISRSTKERPYREKERRSKSKEKLRKKFKEMGKKKEKRKELPRYDVRKIVAEKPLRPRKDEYGRDIRGRSRSKSLSLSLLSDQRRSRSYSPRFSRSRSRNRANRSWSRDRRSLSRKRSLSRERRKSRKDSDSRRHSLTRRKNEKKSPRRKSRKESTSRTRSRRKDRLKKHKSRTRSRNRKRSRSKSPKELLRIRDKKYKRKARSRSRSKERSLSRERTRTWEIPEKSVEQCFSRERESRALDNWDTQWTPSWSRSISKSPPRNPPEDLGARSWSPGVLDAVPPKNLTVILTNKEAMKKKKKERRKESKKSKEVERRRKSKRNRTPPPSKEVFASGDNILVSVCFNKENEVVQPSVPELTETIPLIPPIKRRRREQITVDTPKKPRKEKIKDKRSKSPKAKKEKKKKSRAAEIAATKKPVAVIDLDQSPFREQTPSPRDVIVLSDDDDKQQQEVATPEQCPPSQASPPREQFVSQGPKTPPEPQIKFSITKQTSNLRPSMMNPLLEEEEEEEELEEEEIDERAEEELEMRAQEELELRLKIGPNTPPEPPTSPPTSPDAYDPFDPTKSRSPTPQAASPNDEGNIGSPRKHDDENPPLVEENTQQELQTPQEKTGEKPKVISMVTIKRASPKRDSSPDVESQQDSTQGPASSPKIQPSQQTVQTTSNPFVNINPVLATVAAAVQRSAVFNASTANSSQRNLLQSNRISPSPQIKQRITQLPLPIFSNSVKPPMTRTVKSTQNKIGQNGSENMEMGNDPIDMSSPYSPGSTLSDGIFDPPSPINYNGSPVNTAATSNKNLSSKTSKESKKDAFDALFGMSPQVKIPKNRHKKVIEKKKKCTNPKVGIRMDENQLQILDDLPSSAVEMQVKDKFLKKLNRQERVVEEVKLVLKPHYTKKHVTKEEYKDIMRKAVPKICHNKSGEINPKKIAHLIEAYVKKCRNSKKKPTTTTLKPTKTKSLWS
ncbi:protein split ends isoform X2 [Prorops nasuta]|uniref:protein split ends isoform X2 n=1 Tax=Prorops nasuta TaxID=863751 RepID=UPI0034CF8D4D